MGKSLTKLIGLCYIMLFEHRYEYFTVLKVFKEWLIYLCAQNTLQEKGHF